ncbi:MAG: hypothetical protein HY777_07675 [Betaproteobacteria bacterium]|nr:hypothetical protein [Betaproteobacteria bacterium]
MKFAVHTILALSVCATAALADEADWRTAWDGMLYGYAESKGLRADSVLNPGNRVAHLAQRSKVAELRLNFKAESETVRLTARPIVWTRETQNAFGTEHSNDAWFSQWQVRVRAAEGWNIAAGREVLHWGPAQFRSPSSPFYFDNGRSDPMRELAGMDAAKISWTPDMQNSASLARVARAGRGAPQPQPDTWRDSWLAKFDRRGDSWAMGLAAVKAPDLPAFYGAHGQIAPGDELMLYGEFGSSARPLALQSPADPVQGFAVQTPSNRRSTALLGANYTFEDGKSLAAEYLHDGHGYTSAQESAYFRRAAASPGVALGLAPRLLGRDTLHFVWQSNLMDDKGYWRLMATHGLTDGANELAAYGETVLTRKVIAYLLALLPLGNARQESSSLLKYSATLGLKIALP